MTTDETFVIGKGGPAILIAQIKCWLMYLICSSVQVRCTRFIHCNMQIRRKRSHHDNKVITADMPNKVTIAMLAKLVSCRLANTLGYLGKC